MTTDRCEGFEIAIERQLHGALRDTAYEFLLDVQPFPGTQVSLMARAA